MLRFAHPPNCNAPDFNPPGSGRFRDGRHGSAISRRDAPEWCRNSSPPKTEGVGNAGRQAHPQPRVRMVVAKNAHEYSQRGRQDHPASPRNGLRLSPRSSRRSGFLASVDCGIIFRKLDAGVEASEPHGFAVRKRALSSEALLASTASHPASMTIAIRPSRWDETTEDMKVIWVG